MTMLFLLLLKLLGFGIAVGIGMHLFFAALEAIVIGSIAYLVAKRFDATRDLAFPIALAAVFLPNIAGYVGDSLDNVRVFSVASIDDDDDGRGRFRDDGTFAASAPMTQEMKSKRLIERWRERRNNPDHKPVFPVIYSIRKGIGGLFMSIFSFIGAALRFPSFFMGVVTILEIAIPVGLIVAVWAFGFWISKKYGGGNG